ncbi:hypothetical protein KXW51_007273, partial [Aspergillus fumigatus]
PPTVARPPGRASRREPAGLRERGQAATRRSGRARNVPRRAQAARPAQRHGRSRRRSRCARYGGRPDHPGRAHAGPRRCRVAGPPLRHLLRAEPSRFVEGPAVVDETHPRTSALHQL